MTSVTIANGLLAEFAIFKVAPEQQEGLINQLSHNITALQQAQT